MKKLTCVLLLSCLITAAGFALSETFISVGYENESFFESNTNRDKNGNMNCLF